MRKERSHINKGFSLVEMLVAVSVFLIFVLAIFEITVKSDLQSRNSINRERAVLLAEEGIEASRNIRDASFSNLKDGTFGLATTSGVWTYTGTSSSLGIFNRTITISTINANQKKIDSVVTWSDQTSSNNTVALSSYLTDWKKVIPPAGFTLYKTVINHGDTKVAANFAPYLLGSSTVSLSVATTVDPGTYVVSETTNPNYTQTFTGNCDSSGTIVLASGDSKTCTITNEEKPSKLTVNKTVINHGGTKTVADFTLYVDGTPVTSGDTNTFNSGTHTVSESTDPFYTATIGGDCTSGGVVTLTAGNTKVCSITNEQTVTLPTVTTAAIANIETYTATGGGNVTSDGGATVTSRGVVWSTSVNPTTALSTKTVDGTGTGVFASSITGLLPNTLYHVRAYAVNSVGTAYGSDVTFTSDSICLASLVGTPTTYDNSSANSVVVSKPTGVTQNDIMFALVLHQNGSNILNLVPSGWTLVGRHSNTNSNQALYYKVASASEGTTYTFGFSNNIRVAGTISAYRGCFNTSAPIATSSNIEYVVNNTTYRAASMNVATIDSTVLMFPSVNTPGVQTFANPTTQSGGWTEDFDHGNSGSRFSRAGYRKVINPIGATGAIDSIGSSASTGKHAFGVTLNPL